MEKVFELLRSEVIDVGLCTACGACTGICTAKALEMDYTGDDPEPKKTGRCRECGSCFQVCPGRDIPLPLMEEHFLGRKRSKEEYLSGVTTGIYKAYATDTETREQASSGGVASTLACYLLEKKLVDIVITATMDENDPCRARGVIARDRKGVLAAAGSKYMATPVLEKLADLDDTACRAAIVGLPCHVHAVRKMQLAEKKVGGGIDIAYTLGLFCAGTPYFKGIVHLVEEMCRVPIEEVASMEFRAGDWPGCFKIITRDNRELTVDRHLYVYHFLVFWARHRCRLCFDWSNETADIALGDYWGSKEGLGFSTVVTRSERGTGLLMDARRDGWLEYSSVDPVTLISAGAVEAKKHAGLCHFQFLKEKKLPVPDYHYDIAIETFFRVFGFAPEKSEVKKKE